MMLLLLGPGASSAGMPESIESQVQERIESRVADQVESRVEERVRDRVDEAVGRRVLSAVEPSPAGLSGPGSQQPPQTLFEAAVNNAGERVERGAWVALLPEEQVDELRDWGFTIQRQHHLPALGLALVRVEADGERALVDVARELSRRLPEAVLDYNHLYTPNSVETDADTCERGPMGPSPLPGFEDGAWGQRPRVGLIDSALDENHPAFRQARITSRDFVDTDSKRPRGHGTAVASILVGGEDARPGVLPTASLHAASVLFEARNGTVAASVEGVLRALDWLHGEGVPVINVSLTGPANALLQRGVESVSEAGRTVVAAVGNNGPDGAPLYPAAYESVVGVTAVDACRNAFMFANRGEHVAFSALGVDVPVATEGGGYATDTGTSLAAPYVAGVIAALKHGGASTDDAVAALRGAAVDLGDTGTDPVYGHGLIGPSLHLVLGHLPASEGHVQHQ